MKIAKLVVNAFIVLSLIVNLVVVLVGGMWLHLRMRPIEMTPEKMKETIKELSWNSAGEWRVISQDKKQIIVEYRLPIYDITRFALSKDNFRFSGGLEGKGAPFDLSYEGCDILSKESDSQRFECMKFRDLSPPERKLEEDWALAYDDCAADKALGGDIEAAKECADRYAKEVNARRRWEMVAAENGDSIAQYNYAVDLLATNIPAARSRAFYWLGRSAEQGNDKAEKLLQDLHAMLGMTFPPSPPSDSRK